MIEQRLVWSPTEPHDAPGISFTTTFAVDPEQLPEERRVLLHAHGLVAAQFTIVAGTLAASSRGSSCAQMSSSWIGL